MARTAESVVRRGPDHRVLPDQARRPTGSPASWSSAGVRAAAIHGDRSQKQREKALDSFVRGAVDALVATDVAARGIHVDGVNAVVHFDPPADAKDYVHRSGRTARAGATGVVVSLVTPDKAARGQANLQRDLDVPMGTTAPDSRRITERDRGAAEAPSRRRPPCACATGPDRRERTDPGPGAPARSPQAGKALRSPA